MLVQGDQSDSIQREGNHKLEVTSDSTVLFVWNNCWNGGWTAWSRRRLHLGTSFSRIRNSSSGKVLNCFHASTISLKIQNPRKVMVRNRHELLEAQKHQ